MSLWPLLPRRDIVGRRCLTVNCNHNDINGEPLNMGRGVIRAASHADPSSQDEKVLVEFDGSSDWAGRQWVPIHSQFDVFLVEDTLVGVMLDAGSPGVYQPVLTFKTLVDKINYSDNGNSFRLVESLTADRMLNFVNDADIVHLKDDDMRRMCDSAATNDWVCARSWLSFQQGQHILLSCPSRVISCRVRVYNIANNSQWYSGRIITANENTKSVTILDDGGIEHVENAALVQMELDSRDCSMSLKASCVNVSKPRCRASTEEHPVAKHPKLDSASVAAVDFPSRSPSSASQGPARQLVAPPGPASELNSSTTGSLQIDPGARNLFSAIMTPQPTKGGETPLVFAITTNPLPVSRSVAPVMPAASATSLLLTASRSPPPNPEASKIKTLLGYRPSVMFVIPGPTSPGGTSSAAPPLGSCHTNAQIGGNRQGLAESAGGAGHAQQNPVLHLPPGVEYIGTIPLQMGNPPNNPRDLTPSATATGVAVAAARRIQNQRRASSELLNDGRNQQSVRMTTGQGVHAFQTVGSEVRMQSLVRPHVALTRNQPSMNTVRVQGVGNLSGVQQSESAARLPGASRANFRQHHPGRMQEMQTMSGLQSQGRMPGVQNTSRMQQMLNHSRMPGVQSASVMNQSRMPAMQTTNAAQQMQSTVRMPEVQTANAAQQMQSKVRMPEVQSANSVQQMQTQVRMPEVQSASGVHQVQTQVRMPEVQSANSVQQMQTQVRMPEVQTASGVQQMQTQMRMPEVQTANAVHQMQTQMRMPEVQTASGVHQMQTPIRTQVRMPEAQTAIGVQQMQTPIRTQVRMPEVQSTGGVQQMHSQVRMQNISLSQHQPARMQSAGENQPYAVRNQGMPGSAGIHQMPGPTRFQAVQSPAGNQPGALQFQGMRNVRGGQRRPGNRRGQVRSNSSGFQQIQSLLNSGAGPPGQLPARRMPMHTRFQLAQDQADLLNTNSAQYSRRQNFPESQQAQISAANTLRLPTGPTIRGMQRPANLQGQTSASIRGPRGQTGSLRLHNPSNLRQGLAVNSQANQETMVHDLVENALRKYGLKMNCRMNPDTKRYSAVGCTRGRASPLGSPTEGLPFSLPHSSESQTAGLDGSGDANYLTISSSSSASSMVSPIPSHHQLGRQNSGHPISTTEAIGSDTVEVSKTFDPNLNQNSGHPHSTPEPFSSKTLDVSKAFDTKTIDSLSSLNPVSACDTKYLTISSSSSASSMVSPVPAQGSQTNPAPRQGSMISKTHVYYCDAKSDSRRASIEILTGKRKAPQSNKPRAMNMKHRAMPQYSLAHQPASNSSQSTSSNFLPMSKSLASAQGLKTVLTMCKLDGLPTARNVSSTGANSKLRLPASLPVKASAGGGVPRMWFEEYEDELLDLSQILDMLKRLDSTKCHPIHGSTGDELMPNPKLLTNQMNSLLATPASAHLPEKGRNAPATSQRKSDCETKVKQLQMQLRALGLKFENPSFALSKKKLNSSCESSNDLRICIQDKSCLALSPLLQKCRECKTACNYPSKLSQVLCRFHAFRKLTVTGKGIYMSSGFSSPTDAEPVEISLWMPLLPIVNPQIDVEMAKYIIKNVGNRFCELVEQEKEAMSWIASNGDVSWKRAVNGVREMCDICNTTLFNVHWVCRKCGYVVCLDCYRTKTHKCTRCHDDVTCSTCDRGFLKWAKCSTNRQPHDPKEMMLTQIIPSDVLWVVGRMIHDIRKTWHISENCPCGEDRIVELSEEPSTLEQVNRVTQSDDKVPVKGLGSSETVPSGCEDDSKEKLNDLKDDLDDKSIEKTESDVRSKSGTVKSESPRTLREFLAEKTSGFNGVKLETKPVSSCKNLDDVFRRVMREKQSQAVSAKASSSSSLPDSLLTSDIALTPVGPISSTPQEVAHAWLDSGRLLQLLEPRNPDNIKKFQEVWRKGQPVLFSNCDQYITKELWLPGAFSEEFGDMENDLVDCSHKVVIIGHQMRHFWEGFESVKARLRDAEGNPMILKLKDWPPMEDFSEMLPTRFRDLLQGLPLPEYTDRSGVFNLASRLPEFFVRPDLGPKMYNAYGSALHPLVGSTNLHLDVSDAVNLILYVGIPKDDTEDHEAAALDAMRSAGCCELTMARTIEHGHKPGALWHIFDAKDSDKIRDLLTKVGTEIGEPVEAHHDPIHDQSWYLDETLRARLLHEYSVQGYTLVQCAGDAIFIPAGAPHQVRNLHSCIKAAEDFVSPENLSHCFKMTQEFRHLSETHSNHEDKLQVKNIIYHAVKDAIAVLQNSTPDSA